jgi:hypothetical protein
MLFFCENVFPFKSAQPSNADTNLSKTQNESLSFLYYDSWPMELHISTSTHPSTDVTDTSIIPASLPPRCSIENTTEDNIILETEPSRPRRSIRQTSALFHFVDYHCNLLQGKTLLDSKGVRYPISSTLGYENVFAAFTSFSLTISIHKEP